MNQQYIYELNNKLQQINEFIYQNKPEVIKDLATGKETIMRPAASGKEYTPKLQMQIAEAEQARDAFSKQIAVAKSALQLQNHRKADAILKSNPTLFKEAQTYDEIDFDGIDTTISGLETRERYLNSLRSQIEIQEEKYAELVKAQKKFSNIAHSNDSTISYLNGLNTNIVSQIYAKKQEFVQAVKDSHQMSQALTVRPKGLFAKIKFAFTKGKMEKESKAAYDRVNAIRSEIEEMAKQLPLASNMGAKDQDRKEAKKDPAYQELNDMGIGYTPPYLGAYNLIGFSLEDAKSIIQQRLFESEEYKNAEAEYSNELRKANISEYELQNSYTQIYTQKQQYKQGQERLRQDCMQQLGVNSPQDARDQVKKVRENLRTPQEEQALTTFLKEPKNNQILRGMEEQIKGENQER